MYWIIDDGFGRGNIVQSLPKVSDSKAKFTHGSYESKERAEKDFVYVYHLTRSAV